jgi:hypothetical protein
MADNDKLFHNVRLQQGQVGRARPRRCNDRLEDFVAVRVLLHLAGGSSRPLSLDANDFLLRVKFSLGGKSVLFAGTEGRCFDEDTFNSKAGSVRAR